MTAGPTSLLSGKSGTPVAAVVALVCPSCRSTAIVEAAKPTANTYCRCTSCGDVWSPSRPVVPPRHGWRA